MEGKRLGSSDTMQTCHWKPSPSGHNPHVSQTTACRWQPGSAAQNGYYNIQPMTSQQQNNHQSLCISNGHAVSSPSQPNLFSAHLQTPTLWFIGSKNQFYPSSACSGAPYPNITVQNAPLPSAQLDSHAENISHHPQSSPYSNTTLQNKSAPPVQSSAAVCFLSASSGESSACKDDHLKYGSDPPPYHSLNVQHNITQTTYQPVAHPQQTVPSVQMSQAAQTIYISQAQTAGNGASYSSSPQCSTALQRMLAPSVPPHNRTLQGPSSQSQSLCMVNQVQHSSQVYSQPVAFRSPSSHVSPCQRTYTANNGQCTSLIITLPHSHQSQHNTPNQSQQYTPNQSQQYTPSQSQQYTPSQSQQYTPSQSQQYTPSQSQHNTPSQSQQYSPSQSQHNTPSQSQHNTPSQSQQYSPSQSQSKQRINQILLSSLSKKKITSRLVSGHHSKACLPAYLVNQCNRWPQVQQSNIMNGGMTRTSQDTSSRITSTSDALLPTHSRPVDLSHVSLMSTQVSVQRHDPSPLCSSSHSFESQASGSRSEHQQVPQGQTPSQSAANSRMQTSPLQYGIPPTPFNGEIQRTNEHQACDKATGVGEGNDRAHGSHLEVPLKDVERQTKGAKFSRFRMDYQIKKGNGQSEEGQGVQYCVDPADCLEVVLALNRVVRPTNRAVAVVPPISQQATSSEERSTPSTDDGLPFKIDTVWSLVKEGEDVQNKLNSQSQPIEITESQFVVPSVPVPEIKDSVKPTNGSTVDNPSCEVISSEKDPTLESQSDDIPQTEIIPVSMSQCANMSQEPTKESACSPDVASKCPPQQNDDENDSYLNDSFDLSNATLEDFTLQKLRDLVKSLELEQIEGQKEDTTDVLKNILDLYWDGEEQNIPEALKETIAIGLLKTSSQVSVKESNAMVFQYLDLEILKTSNRYHILERDTILTTEEFRSSLYSDGQLTDEVLAEPTSDYDFTWAKDMSHSLLDSTINCEGSLVQVNADDLENKGVTTHKDVSDMPPKISEKSFVLDTCQSKSDSEVIIPAKSDRLKNVRTLNDVLSNLVCDRKSPREASKKQDVSEKQKEDQQIDEHVDMVAHVTNLEIPCTLSESNNKSAHDGKGHKNIGEDSPSPPGTLKSKPNDSEQQTREYKQTQTDFSVSASLANSSDQEGKSDGGVGDRCEMEDISDDHSFDSLLMEVTLLSSADAETIFKEYSHCDQLGESPQLCQNDPKDSAIMTSNEPEHLTSKRDHRSDSHIRFTCPHVTNIICDYDHFCAKCWAETPLLDLDLDEVVSTPIEGESNITSSKPDDQRQNSGPPAGKSVEEPVAPVCPESDGIAVSTPNSDGSDIMTASPKPDETQSYTVVCHGPQDPESLQKEFLPSGSFTKPTADKIFDATASPRAESPRSLSDIRNIVMSDLLAPKLDELNVITVHQNPYERQSNNSVSDEQEESLEPEGPSSVVINSAKDKMNGMTSSSTQSCNGLSDTGNRENEKPISLPQTKTIKRNVSPLRDPPRKRLKLNKIRPMPADDLFTPDIVIKRTKSTDGQDPGVQLLTSSFDGHNSINEKENKIGEKKQRKEKHYSVKKTSKSNQHSTQTELDSNRMCQKAPVPYDVPKISKTIQNWNVAPQDKKKPAGNILAKFKKSQPNSPIETQAKRDTKISLALYGPHSRNSDDHFMHRCHDRATVSAAPAYVTVSPKPAISKTCTDVPTARQKVYSDWCNTFVQKNNMSSHKKLHKRSKNDKITRLKAIIRKRTKLT